MKEYTNLEIEVISFNKADVIVASGGDSEHDNGYINWDELL